MTATCNVSSVLTDSTIRISASGNGGTGPYRIIISNGTAVLLDNSNVAEGIYVFIDVILSIGTYNFNAYVINSCGASSVVEQCIVNASTCPAPGCSFNVSVV